MLFNSIEFFIFLPLAFILYWFVFKSLRIQNALVLLLSYIFYGMWEWRFLGLILLSTICDYLVGVFMSKSSNRLKRKLLLLISLLLNLGLLLYFKYCNFFLDSFCDLMEMFNLRCTVSSLSIILPVGISFYTFQTLSYSIDVYRGKLDCERDFVTFAAYVSFFPQLVAGPIERASNLLPQFNRSRKFDITSAINGTRQILWGLFKKVVIADNCALVVDAIFNNSGSQDSVLLIIGAVFFAFQIYGDFSGYSDIAIGVGKLFGINLMTNFKYPYFSRDIAEFWRRWHISLSTWFRDYIYIPLGGSRVTKWISVRNIFIIFLVSGFWHGANWTFIFFLPQFLRGTNRKFANEIAEKIDFNNISRITLTFILTTIGWVFFRSDSISQAFTYLGNIFVFPYLDLSNEFYYSLNILTVSGFIVFMLLLEWLGRYKEFPLYNLENTVKNSTLHIFCIVYLLFYGSR